LQLAEFETNAVVRGAQQRSDKFAFDLNSRFQVLTAARSGQGGKAAMPETKTVILHKKKNQI